MSMYSDQELLKKIVEILAEHSIHSGKILTSFKLKIGKKPRYAIEGFTATWKHIK